MNREFLATITATGTGSSPPDNSQGESDIAVRVEPADGRIVRVIIDGREYEVDAARVRPGTWSLIVDGRSLVVDIDERRIGSTLFVGQNEVTVDLDDARRKRLARAMQMQTAGAGGGSGEIVRAPIAGKVVKLLVADGEQVEVGQGVVVLEAMKMENRINAERGGQVATLHVSEGQSVETNDKLVTLS